MDAVEDGRKAGRAEKPLVFDKHVDGYPSRGANREGIEACIVEGSYPFARCQVFHHCAEISGQRALPAEGVDAIAETR